MEKNVSKLKLLLLLCLFGWAVSLYTLWHKSSLVVKGAVGDAFCNINDKFNCDVVALSSYSEFFGVSVSAWGMSFYVVFSLVALWSLFSHTDKKEWAPATLKWLGFLSLGSLGFSAYLAYTSFFILETGCVMCLLIYLINFSMLFVLWGSFKESLSMKLIKLPSWVYVSALVLVALHLFLPKMMESSISGGTQLSRSDAAIYINAHLNEKKQNIITESLPFLGAEEAAITIVEYSDYQCPWCAKSSKILPIIVKEFGRSVKIVYKNYPIDASCNEDVKHSAHPFACYAAKTATCVYKNQGNERFMELKQKLFENQNSLSNKNIDQWAMDISGMSQEELTLCRNSDEVSAEIQRQIREAKRLGIEATPSHYINGRYLKGAIKPEILKGAISHYLQSTD